MFHTEEKLFSDWSTLMKMIKSYDDATFLKFLNNLETMVVNVHKLGFALVDWSLRQIGLSHNSMPKWLDFDGRFTGTVLV